MRLYIGSFDENEAENVVSDLRKAGIKSELKPSLDTYLDVYYFVEGRLSELKDKYKRGMIAEILKEMESNLETAKSIIKDGIEIRDFEEEFLDRVMPERKKYAKMKDNIKNIFDEKSVEALLEEFNEKIDEKEFYNFIDHLYNEMNLITSIHSTLERNGIRYETEKMYGKIDENPYVKIYIDTDESGAEEFDLQEEFETLVDKNVDVYANLMDIIYEIEKVEKLCVEKPQYSKLLFMANLVGRILKKIRGKNGKMDVDQLIDEIKEMQEENGETRLTTAAINEVLKTMKKAEMIKIKNRTIALRK